VNHTVAAIRSDYKSVQNDISVTMQTTFYTNCI